MPIIFINSEQQPQSVDEKIEEATIFQIDHANTLLGVDAAFGVELYSLNWKTQTRRQQRSQMEEECSQCLKTLVITGSLICGLSSVEAWCSG